MLIQNFALWAMCCVMLVSSHTWASESQSFNPQSPNPPPIGEIKRVKPISSYPSYREFVEGIREKAKKAAMVDRLQKSIDPREFNRLQNNTESFYIQYPSDGLKISGVMAYPKSVPEGKKLPVVIYNRGGNAKHHLRMAFLYRFILPLAEQGYLVLASNYRGAKFSEGKDEFGGADVNDVKALVDLVKTISFADANSIQMVGSSRGAMMTLLAAKDLPLLKSATVIAGVSDMEKHIQYRPEMGRLLASYVPDFKTHQQQALDARSAVKWVDKLPSSVPIMIMHGTQDSRVKVSQAKALAAALKVEEHPYELRLYPNGDHGLTFFQPSFKQDLFEFLAQHR